MSFAIDPLGTTAVYGAAAQTLASKMQSASASTASQSTNDTTNGHLNRSPNANAGASGTDASQTESSTTFSRYSEQYRRLSAIVLDKDGRYDRQAQIRAYMELQSMASSGKLKGMEADDQRLWMEISNQSVSLLQQSEESSDTSDSSDTSATTDTSVVTSLFNGSGISTVQADEMQDASAGDTSSTQSSATTQLQQPLQQALANRENDEQQAIGKLISLSA